ncbi:hypothetical protein GP475_10365 [Corynebacterium poyangense]|uniref:Uncharacterized protein n=1 Tax=Corynebacterium poyangense TaxID=2684405 RepID=A0A7H0SR15_9CORY|nr:hypothetical protein [Corynebacterium poyangense]MBZ8176410.1 hypothetical protein [Corynebacterium poyangense]QNQ90990.1 hypothetical protein GP475_10365 [Corynebacterium poyangense]
MTNPSQKPKDMLLLLEKARFHLNEAIEALDAIEKVDGPEIREHEFLSTMYFGNALGYFYSFMVDDLDKAIEQTKEYCD